MVRRLTLIAPAFLMMLSGCVRPNTDAEVSTVPRAEAPTVALPVVVALPAIGVGFVRTIPSPAETGPPPSVTVPAGPGCKDGWRTPPAASRDFRRPVGVIARTMGMDRPLVVVAMRYFEGPESPPSDKGYLAVVRRWYVKGYERGARRVAARWLVEERDFGIGLVAVAPYGTTGYRSPDWVGFQYESAGEFARPRTYPGLPGRWAGIPYDFVGGGAGLRSPGLPDEVAGCLADA